MASSDGAKPKRRVRTKPDIPSYLNLCRNKSPSPPSTPPPGRMCMSDGDENLENLLSSLNFSKFRLGSGRNKTAGTTAAAAAAAVKGEKSTKVDRLRELTERLKPDRRDKTKIYAQNCFCGDDSASSLDVSRDPPPPPPLPPPPIPFVIQCDGDAAAKEDDVFEESKLQVGKLNSSIIVGSYAQRTIPFRSASFSQVDVNSDGKYIRSARNQLTLKPPVESDADAAAGGSATLPRKKYSENNMDSRPELKITVEGLQGELVTFDLPSEEATTPPTPPTPPPPPVECDNREQVTSVIEKVDSLEETESSAESQDDTTVDAWPGKVYDKRRKSESLPGSGDLAHMGENNRKLRTSASLEDDATPEKIQQQQSVGRSRAHTMTQERRPVALRQDDVKVVSPVVAALLSPERESRRREKRDPEDVANGPENQNDLNRCGGGGGGGSGGRMRTVSPSPVNFDSDSSIGSERGVTRSPHGPRRYSKRPLRGPYGEMLEAEMSKSELNKIFATKTPLNEELNFLRELTAGMMIRDAKSSSPRSNSPVSPLVTANTDPWLRSMPIHANHSLDDSQLKVGYHTSSVREPPRRKISANIPFLASDAVDPNMTAALLLHPAVVSPLHHQNHEPPSSPTLGVSHHRTASSPCHLQIFADRDDEMSPYERDTFVARDTTSTSAFYLPESVINKEELVESPRLRIINHLAPPSEEDAERTVNNSNGGECRRKRNVTRSPSFKRHRDTRTHVVGELYDTERSYVESLQIVVTKYLQPLKNPDTGGLIDAGLVDEIFYQIPAILGHHEIFLEEMRVRLETWETKQTIGDIFLESFTKQAVIDTYTAFINNWKNAKEVIKGTCQAKPAFARFLEAKAREHTGKLALDSLLIMPVQRIPRYELLIKELLKHTNKEHPDHSLLLQAQREVHDLAVKINCVEREALETEQQLQVLKEVEGLIEGLVNLVSVERTFLRHDLVTMASGQGTRKERCLFFFSDLLVITSIKRKSATMRKPSTNTQGSITNTLEANKYKLLMKIPLDDLEIAKSKDENLRRLMKEVATLEEDVTTLSQIVELTSSLHCPHAALEESAREMLTNMQRQLAERQASDSQLAFLELALTTQDGIENLSVVFSSPEKRTSWEETFHEAKQKLVLSADRHPPPEFLQPLPIRKTRAGLQFICASPTLALNSHQLRDVWVCNSDGFVGQVCVLSLQPDPTVTSCNGVCNARILAIASIPAIASPDGETTCPVERRSAFNESSKSSISISVEDIDERPNNIQLDSSSSEDDDDAILDDSNQMDDGIGITRSASMSAGGSGGDDSPLCPHQSPTLSTCSSYDPSDTQPTMWLGTEDGSIHVYNCTDNIRIKKNKVRMQHNTAVHCIIYLDNKVFVALGNGTVVLYSREPSGWNTSDPRIINVSSLAAPVTKMLAVGGKLWCCCQNTVRIIDTTTLDIENSLTVQPEALRSVTCLVSSGLGVWIASQNSACVRLFHAKTYEFLGEVNMAPAVTKMLAGCDDIIRQHKAACLRVTAMLACKDLLWVGTSAGVILNLPVPHITPSTSKITTIPTVTGIPHGHTGHVRFLTSVEMKPPENRNPRSKFLALHHRYSSQKSKESDSFIGSHQFTSNVGKNANNFNNTSSSSSQNGNRLLVISGGDGYEDFRSSGASEVAGREDSTNHLLLWQV